MLILRAMAHSDDLDHEMPVVLDRTLVDSWRDILRQALKEVA